jgi:hypothetical protein
MKVKIGFCTYPVRVMEKVSNESHDDDEDPLGRIDYYSHISIKDNQPDQSKLHTLVHEVIHGLLRHYGLDAYVDKEGLEDFVDGFSGVLLDFMVSNPGLVNLVLRNKINWDEMRGA